MNNKDRFLKYLQTCVKSTRATDSNPLLMGGNAPKDYSRFLESDRLFDYNPSKWAHIGSMYDINDYNKALDVFNDLIADEAFLKRDKEDNQGWRRGAISHYVCFLSAQEFFSNTTEQKKIVQSVNKVNEPLQQIFYGAPGTGKSNTIKKEVEDKGRLHFRTTFHPDSDYSTFVGCYKPTMKTVKKTVVIGQDEAAVKPLEGCADSVEQISYSFVPQAFSKAYCEAWNKYGKSENAEPVFLIIEEINRGNCAQIFGDIFQLLDREVDGERCGFSTYPIDADEDLKAFLENGTKKDGTQWLTNKDGIKDGKLCLPPNMYIWATMNTSDQSLFPIDSAFKRRWNWKYMPINTKKENWTIKIDDKDYSWSSFLERINEEIDSTTHSEDKMLGFYFCRANNNVIDADKFVSKVLFYLYNDVFKDYGLDRELFKGDDGKTISFRSYYKIDGSIDTDKVKNFLDNLKVDDDENKPVAAETALTEDNA